jgi:hypothetical protein
VEPEENKTSFHLIEHLIAIEFIEEHEGIFRVCSTNFVQRIHGVTSEEITEPK